MKLKYRINVYGATPLKHEMRCSQNNAESADIVNAVEKRKWMILHDGFRDMPLKRGISGEGKMSLNADNTDFWLICTRGFAAYTMSNGGDQS